VSATHRRSQASALMVDVRGAAPHLRVSESSESSVSPVHLLGSNASTFEFRGIVWEVCAPVFEITQREIAVNRSRQSNRLEGIIALAYRYG
jgi:hypothetical protein